MALAREPLCRFCTAKGRVVPATVVDHIETINEAPHLRLDLDNLRSLCKPCHDERTMRDSVRR
jgi:5-methylcytosine-specific restriction protein A